MESILSEILHQDDSFIITAQGLLYPFHSRLLEIFNDNSCLILSLSSNPSQAPSNRTQAYNQGGIINFSPTVILLDLLNNVLPINLLSGVFIYDAHRFDSINLKLLRITANSLEAFILRLIRQRNKKSFFKAFSDHPEQFKNIEKSMKTLFLRSLSLFPRFHIILDSYLQEKPASKLIEITVPLSKQMKIIQASLMECVHQSLMELKRINSFMDVTDITVENALFKSFDSILHTLLDPMWHKLSSKTKQLVTDIKLLRRLSSYLLNYDPISFYSFLEFIRVSSIHSESVLKNHDIHSWILIDAAGPLFDAAKSRVNPSTTHFICEELPKWRCLLEILKEIEIKRDENDKGRIIDGLFDFSAGPILILTQDQRTCNQLQDILNGHDLSNGPQSKGKYLTSGSETLIKKLLISHNRMRESLKPQPNTAPQPDSSHSAPLSKRRRVRGSSKPVPQTPVIPEEQIELFPNMIEPLNFEDDLDVGDLLFNPTHNNAIEPRRTLIISSVNDSSLEDSSFIQEIDPEYVILYDPDPSLIRTVEYFQATDASFQIKVYFMMYQEQRYLTTIRKEKESFERLIHQKSIMSIPIDQDGRIEPTPEQTILSNLNTRISGGQIRPLDSKKILVDTREFKSELPNILHSQSFEIIPCMLEIGDYILSPHLCVERKSINDLISSFKSGRLFSQCESMQKHFSRSILLIEFNESKLFSLPFPSSTLSPNDIQSKITLLLLSFPKLFVLWSSSLIETSKFFRMLKVNQDEPVSKTKNAYFSGSMDLLNTLDLDHSIVIKHVGSLRELFGLSMDRMIELFGEKGRKLYDFVNEE